MRVLGRWMRMLTIPNQSSVAKAFQEFDGAGRMKPSAYYDRIVDVMEELMKFTLLTRDVMPLTLPLFRVALNPRFTRPFYAVPRTSAARTASG